MIAILLYHTVFVCFELLFDLFKCLIYFCYVLARTDVETTTVPCVVHLHRH